MTDPVFAVYAYGEMELGRASDQKADAASCHTESVDTEDEEK